MGGPVQRLYFFKELEAQNEQEGERLKREAKRLIEEAASEDIAKVIIVVRSPMQDQDVSR